MRLPVERGPLSSRLIVALATGQAPDLAEPRARADTDEVFTDEDAQISLWILNELHYRGFDDVDADREWDPDLIRMRRHLEVPFERALRRGTQPTIDAVPDDGDIAAQLLSLASADDGPSLAAYLHRHATRDQIVGFLRERSLYHLKESDPHAFVLARIDGPAKAALAELLYDEYGGGRPERLHATMYADALESCGLDPSYGAYVDDVSALTLSVNNLMSLFGLQRRLRGAAMGHLAAFEATSSVPCRKIASGIERVALPPAAAVYFQEHVEADAVHEQIVVRDICASLVAATPQLRSDVLFGAAACLYLDALAGAHTLRAWQNPEAA